MAKPEYLRFRKGDVLAIVAVAVLAVIVAVSFLPSGDAENVQAQIYQNGELIETLCACRRVGANLLLNIGPTAQGGIVPIQKELMAIMGRWMNFYGEAIYRGKPHPATCGNKKNFVLRSDDSLYFFVHDLRSGGSAHVAVPGEGNPDFTFHGVEESIESMEWMDNNEPLTFTATGNTVKVDATGFRYGFQTCVRVAKAKLRK